MNSKVAHRAVFGQWGTTVKFMADKSAVSLHACHDGWRRPPDRRVKIIFGRTQDATERRGGWKVVTYCGTPHNWEVGRWFRCVARLRDAWKSKKWHDAIHLNACDSECVNGWYRLLAFAVEAMSWRVANYSSDLHQVHDCSGNRVLYSYGGMAYRDSACGGIIRTTNAHDCVQLNFHPMHLGKTSPFHE